MDVGKRIRIGLAAGVATTAAGAIALAGTVQAGAPFFRPDLETISPGTSPVDLVVKEKSGKVLLRLSNKIANAGTGPLELAATEATGVCIGGDDPDEPDRDATQVLYEDSAPFNGVYDPDDEPGEATPVGCFEYHSAPGHDHWHFQDFAQFRLETAEGDPIEGIEPSRKIGFCVLDGDRPFPELPGSPSAGVYPQNTGTGFGCGQSNPDDGPGAMGLSVGYADIYTYSLPGQKLDVTGVTRGTTYCLVSIANPPEGASEIIESNTANNERRKPIRINPAQDKAKFLDGTCPDPTP